MTPHDDGTDAPATTPIEGQRPEDTPTFVKAPLDPSASAMLAPGSTVANRYRIVALAGQGGMGAVYRADDLVLGQPVALKFISGHPSRRAIERLTDEVRIGRRITHPNACRLHDIVESEGRHFLVMEFVDGEDLSSLLSRLGALPDETAQTIAYDIAAGLAAAHAQGIVHRDLKPGNVMIDGHGRARITDFGLAIASETGGSAEIAGTPAYMAPEQIRGESVDARADIYALGLILCEIYTGQRLNEGRKLSEIASSPAVAPTSLTPWVPQIDPAVEQFILRSLDPDPAKRPASVRELLALLPEADALRMALAAGETPTMEMVAASLKSGTMRRRTAAGIVTVIIAGLLGTAGVAERSRLASLSRISPETLQGRAQEVVERFAPDLKHGSSVWWFEPDREMIRSERARATRTWSEIAALDAKLVRFVYRQSDAPLVARNTSPTISSLYILQSGRVTLDDPPLAPGMATVILDRNGELLRVDAVGEDGQARSDPESRPPLARARPRSALARSTDALQVALMIGTLVIAIIFALRNRRSGRADLRGATRLVVYTFSSLLLAWLCLCNHVPDARNEAMFFSVGFGTATSAAVILWFFYLALEPFVRRRFPEALISWSRLLNGRIRDSLVARDLLVGIAGGILGRLLIDAVQAAPALWGGHPRVSTTMEPIGPLQRVLGNVLVLQVDSIEIGIGAIFLLVFLQKAFRKTSIAVLAWFVVFLGVSLTVPTLAPYLALLLILLLRFGLLTTITANLVNAVLLYASLTLDPTAWFFGRSLAVLIVIATSTIVLGVMVTRARDAPRELRPVTLR